MNILLSCFGLSALYSCIYTVKGDPAHGTGTVLYGSGKLGSAWQKTRRPPPFSHYLSMGWPNQSINPHVFSAERTVTSFLLNPNCRASPALHRQQHVRIDPTVAAEIRGQSQWQFLFHRIGLSIPIHFLQIRIQQFFSIRIRIQLKKLCKKLPDEEFSEVEKNKEDCSKV